MLISGGSFPGPVTMKPIDICGQTESGMGGLRYREMRSEIIEFQFSGPTGAMTLKLERDYPQLVFRSIVPVPIRTAPVMPSAR